MIAEWGSKLQWEKDLETETSPARLNGMPEEEQKELFFEAIRVCNLVAFRNLVQHNRSLVTEKMYGFEGADVYEVIKNSKTHRCYTLTGLEKDGFFYPIHVAAEAGRKVLVLLLIKLGADPEIVDYRGDKPESKCNGDALGAFYELRGLHIEALERYEGEQDRHGQRSGSGTLYYKPEGYKSEEHVLYVGSFKNGLYSGYGVLFWPGSDKHRYAGRFKMGQMHGRGISFDENGERVYQGSFRENCREGRGEEFEGGVRVYKGEFSKGLRHGFGICYFGDEHIFMGRFEQGAMAGVGIYKHQNGDRFEGTFYNNKPDGQGSFYKLSDPHSQHNNQQPQQQHGMWSMGRLIKDLTTPFVPTSADLPDTREVKNVISKIIQNNESSLSIDNVTSLNIPSGDPSMGSAMTLSSVGSLTDPSSEDSQPLSWKVTLAQYVRISQADAKALGIELPKSNAKNSPREGNNSLEGGVDNDEGNDDEVEDNKGDEDMDDEVMGYHFLSCTQLFVAYVYVCSAAKVFEGRLAISDMQQVAPDFEAVYHLVIDTVDSYNEAWENEARSLQSSKEGELEAEAASVTATTTDGMNDLEAKRRIFLTEKEKKDEQIMKQRSELAAKKGMMVLDPDVEAKLGEFAIYTLENELTKLLITDESENEVADKEEKGNAGQGGGDNAKRGDKKKFGRESLFGTPLGNEFAAELLYILRTANEFNQSIKVVR